MSDLEQQTKKGMKNRSKTETSRRDLDVSEKFNLNAYNDADASGHDDDDGDEEQGIYLLSTTGLSKISDVQFPLILVAVSSMILLIAVITWEGPIKSREYCISIPSISLCLSLGGVFAMVFREDLYADYGGKYLAHFLMIWNFVGASYMTFNSPFITTGNGYFACWCCVATSAMAMGYTADAFKNTIQGLGSLMGLFGSSIVMIFALVEYIFGDNAPELTRHASIYALTISCLTIALILGIVYFNKKYPFLDENDVQKVNMIKFIVMSVFAVLWLVLACLVTFHGPFVTTGNGYFSSWTGCVCISFTAFAAKKECIGVNDIDLKYVTETVTGTVTGATESVTGFLKPSSDNNISNNFNDSFSSATSATALSKTIT
jgi:hypothetical protein